MTTDEDMDDFQYNIYTISICLFILLLYVLLSYGITIYRPSSSFKIHLARASANSFLWIQKHKEKNDPASVTLAIQTFRNTILVAIFIGGIAFQSAISLATSFRDLTSTVGRIRHIILSVFLFLSFLCWTSVIRSASHLGYLTGVLSYESSQSIPTSNDIETAQHMTVDQEVTNENQDDLESLVRQEETMFFVMLLSFRYPSYHLSMHMLSW